MANYDMLNGGISQLISELKAKKKEMQKVEEGLNLELAELLVDTIKIEAGTIDYNYQMYDAMYNGNVIDVDDKGVRVVNITQHATYAEYGTGIVGSENPHPRNDMGWEYDVNNHGDYGWRYMLDGKFYFTKGVASNPVYLRSAEIVRKKIPDVIRKRLVGAKNE